MWDREPLGRGFFFFHMVSVFILVSFFSVFFFPQISPLYSFLRAAPALWRRNLIPTRLGLDEDGDYQGKGEKIFGIV